MPGDRFDLDETETALIGRRSGAAIRLGDPVLFIEHKRLYTMREDLPENAPLPPIGKARVARAGEDVTLIAYSAMVPTALEAAEELGHAGISVSAAASIPAAIYLVAAARFDAWVLSVPNRACLERVIHCTR